MSSSPHFSVTRMAAPTRPRTPSPRPHDARWDRVHAAADSRSARRLPSPRAVGSPAVLALRVRRCASVGSVEVEGAGLEISALFRPSQQRRASRFSVGDLLQNSQGLQFSPQLNPPRGIHVQKLEGSSTSRQSAIFTTVFRSLTYEVTDRGIHYDTDRARTVRARALRIPIRSMPSTNSSYSCRSASVNSPA